MHLLEKIDNNDIPNNLSEIRLVVVLKNERLRIPYMLKYYKEIGVDRFFIIDHHSTDGWEELVKDYSTVHIFKPKVKTNDFRKSDWKHEILREFCDGHWTVLIDPDELLVYPYCERKNLKELSKFMEYERANVLRSSFLDIYSPNLLKDAVIKEGQNPLEILTHFDNPPIKFYSHKKKQFYDFRRQEDVPYVEGGVLHRVTGHLLLLNKVDFLKYDKTMSVMWGHHFVKGRYIRSSSIIGSVLHAKYTADMTDFVKDSKVKNYAGGGWVYNSYKNKGLGQDSFTFWTPNSTEYTGSEQLIDLGIIRSNTRFYFNGWSDLIQSQRTILPDNEMPLNIANNDVKIDTLKKYLEVEEPEIVLDTSFNAGCNASLILSSTKDSLCYSIGKNSELELKNKEILKDIFPEAKILLNNNKIEEINGIQDNFDFVFIDETGDYVEISDLFQVIVNKVNINGTILVNNCQLDSIKSFLNEDLLKGWVEIYLNVHDPFPLRAFRKIEQFNLDFGLKAKMNTLKIIGIGLSLSGNEDIQKTLATLNFKTASFVKTSSIDCAVINNDYIGDIPLCNYFEEIDKKYNAKFIYTKKNIDKWLKDCEDHWQALGNNIDPTTSEIRKSVYGIFHFDKDVFRDIYTNLDKKINDYFKDKSDKLLIIDDNVENIAKRLIAFIGVENLSETP